MESDRERCRIVSLINDFEENALDGIESTRSRVSDHAKLAGCVLVIGSLPTILYAIAFSQFEGSELPWKISMAIQLASSSLIFVHYLTNRNSSRMWYEGCAATLAGVAFWFALGSCSFVYFGFAPMPFIERVFALTFFLLGTIFWMSLVWVDYVKKDEEFRLRETLYIEEAERVIYWGAKADGIVARLPQRNPFTRAHFWLVSMFGPLLGGICIIVLKIVPQSSGPHAMFLVLSFLSFPLSQWILGYLVLRTVYFHIYLPLKIERETGKKVILGP